jgi:exosortase A-associated hydrolase 2
VTRGKVLQPLKLSVRPRFLDAPSGPLFCVEFPAATPGAGVLVVAPIGEEMNKCRRMMALAARALQAAGLTATLVDCHGTGDSAGDHREATVALWRSDLQRAVRRLRELDADRVHVLAIRSGALLPDSTVLEGVSPGRLCLWQPVSSGRQVMTQWLRLAAAGDVVAGTERGGEQRAREMLDAQGYVEIAGYDISRDLAVGLERLELRPVLQLGWQRIAWLEVAAEDGAQLTPAATRALAAAGSDLPIESRAVAGEPFWATPEIATSNALIAATREFLVRP